MSRKRVLKRDRAKLRVLKAQPDEHLIVLVDIGESHSSPSSVLMCKAAIAAAAVPNARDVSERKAIKNLAVVRDVCSQFDTVLLELFHAVGVRVKFADVLSLHYDSERGFDRRYHSHMTQ